MKRPTFNGDNAALAARINSLLELDKNNALVPHGLGGLARQLLEASAERLAKEHQEVRFVCSSFPSGEPDSCVFVECENSAGCSINAGEWRKREDGLVELVVHFQGGLMKALIIVGGTTGQGAEETAAGIAALVKNYEINTGQKVDSVEIKYSSEYYHGHTTAELPPLAYLEQDCRPARQGKGERKRNKKDRWR